jgi:hypothetical protein
MARGLHALLLGLKIAASLSARLIRRRTLARSETLSDCFEAPSEKFIRILRWILSQAKETLLYGEILVKAFSCSASFCEFLLMQCVERN